MIRNLLIKDREVIKNILAETNHFNEEEIKIALELIDLYLNDSKQTDYIIFVFVDDESGKTAGYICWGKRPMTDATYDLYWIAVDPKIHGKGIGSKLIGFMEDEIKITKGNLILIETSGKSQYEGERKFYERNGYKVQTVINDFYRYGDDLYVYHKYLN
jgi:ribosomal protein S18 acetylase RimI-like enzyme